MIKGQSGLEAFTRRPNLSGLKPFGLGEADMKGTPRSFFLSTANRVAGWWTAAGMNVARQQQCAIISEMIPAKRQTKKRKMRTPSTRSKL